MAHFLDTSVLLYSISRNPAEARKRERAIELLEDDDGALSIQVLQEFYAEVTRTSRADAVPHQLAVGLIEAWTRFRVQDMTLDVLNEAMAIRLKHGLSFGDSLMVGAARVMGCDRVYAEELRHGQEVDGVRVVNPFR